MHTLVLGAGSAGSVLAARLSENGNEEVTLVEAGPDYPSIQDVPEDLRDGRQNARGHDWGYRFRPASQRDNTFAFPRGRVVGGSSAVNTCIALRGHPYDYDEWAALGLTEWSFKRCLPAFKRLEHDLDFEDEWHGRGGPIPIRRHSESEWVPWQAAFVEAARRLGYPETVDHNNPELPCGVGPHAMNKVAGERMSAARCYLTQSVRRRRNLHVRAGFHVVRILFREKRFAGVEVRDERGATSTLTGDRIIVAGGAMGSLGILLRSGIGPKRELDRMTVPVVVDSPTVGARLLDHSGTAVIFAPRAKLVPSTTDPLIQVMARATTLGSDHPYDLQIQPGSFLPIFGLDVPLFSIMAPIGRPEARGVVRFPSSDPLAKPHIEMGFLDHPRDRANVLEAVERIYEIARQPEIRALAFPVIPTARVLSRRDELLSDLPKITGSGYHPCGTIPMSARSIEDGAVDALGRLRGVEGVLVADASIFPIIPTANTNLPTLMLAEKIAGELQAGATF
jgi:choline dehydrogenase